MVRAGRSGIIYDFFTYSGEYSTGADKCGAENSVLRLVQNIPKHQNYQGFFDNWFSTFPLLLKLQFMGILATATFKMNCLARCPLMSDKDLKKEGRGTFDCRTDKNSTLRVVKWHDNKAVTVGSTFGGVGASSTKKQWDAKSKDHVDVSYPDMIRDYNQSMGGVDLSDMLIPCRYSNKREMVLENNYPLLKHMQRQCMVIASKIYAAAECLKIKSNYAPRIYKKLCFWFTFGWKTAK